MSSLLHRLENREIERTDLLPPELEEFEKPEDWIKITALVTALLAGIVAGCAGMTIAGYFPVAIFGGWKGACLTMSGIGCIAFGAGAIFYYRYKYPPA